MPIPFIAVPVVHATCGWIAYAGSGYVAGTTASTAFGAFVAGNATLLASAGAALTTVGGIFGAKAAYAAAFVTATPTVPVVPIVAGAVVVAGVGALALDRYLKRKSKRGLVSRIKDVMESRKSRKEINSMRASMGLGAL